MTRVDFYVLAASGEQARKVFACKLAEKAYRLDNTVHIHADDEQSVQQLDTLLWTFRDGSFVPHNELGAADIEVPVTIGCGTPPERTLLINLSSELPDFAGRFERIAEVVSADDDVKKMTRERFARYRDMGFTLETHKL